MEMRSEINRVLTVFFFFVLISSIAIVLFGRQINYGHSSHEYLALMALYNYLLVFFELLGGLGFLFLTYMMIRSFYIELAYFTSSFYAGISLWLLLGLGIIYFIPAILYLNNFMLFSHIFSGHWLEIQSLAPDVTFSDFVVSLMDAKGNDAEKKGQIPPMGGHLVTYGNLSDGTRYACADIARSINESFFGLAKGGAQLGKAAQGMPDVACQEFGKSKVVEEKK